MISLFIITVKICFILGISGLLFIYMLSKDDRKLFQNNLITILPAFYFAGMWIPTLLILSLFTIVYIAIITKSKSDCSSMLPVVLVSLPALSFPLSIGNIGIGYYDTWTTAIIAVIFISWIKLEEKVLVHGMILPVLLFAALYVVANSRGVNATSLLRVMMGGLITIILPYAAVRAGLTRPEHLRRFMLSIIFSAAILSMLALYETRMFWPTYEMIYTHYDVPLGRSQALKVRGGLMRAATSFPESTSFGLYCGIALSATVAMWDSFRSRGAALLVMLMIAAGLFAAQARIGWLAFGLALVFMDCFHRRFAQAAIKVGGAIVMVMTTQALSRGSGRLADMTGAGGGAGDTVEYRQILLQRGMEEIRKHPLVGTDIASVMRQLEDMRQGEGIIDFVNAYIFYGLTTGIMGIVALILVFAISSWRLFVSRALLSHDPVTLQVGAFCFSVSSLFVIAAFTSGFGGITSLQYFMIMGCASATLAIARDKEEQRAAATAVSTSPSGGSYLPQRVVAD